MVMAALSKASSRCSADLGRTGQRYRRIEPFTKVARPRGVEIQREHQRADQFVV